MSASAQLDGEEQYLIPSVPSYRERLADENDDTLGDKFFEMLALETVSTAAGVKTPKMEPKTRPVRRSSVLHLQQANTAPSLRNSTKTVQPEKENVDAKSSVAAEDLKSTSKTASTSTRRALSRFETAAKPLKIPSNEGAAPPAPKVQPQPRPVRRSTMQMRISMADPNQNVGDVVPEPVKTLPQVPQSTRRSVAVPREQPNNETTTTKPNKPKPSLGPTIIQPPMRFGNIPSVRRSAMPGSSRVSINAGASSSRPTLVQPPMRFGSCSARRSAMPDTASTPSMVTRSRASAATNLGAGTQGIQSRASRASGQQRK